MFTKEFENQNNLSAQSNLLAQNNLSAQNNSSTQTPPKKRDVRKELNYIKPKERKPEQPIEEISEFQALVKDVFRNLSSGNKYAEDYCFHKSQLTEILGLCEKAKIKVAWEEKEGIYYIRKGTQKEAVIETVPKATSKPTSKSIPIPSIQENLRHQL